MPPTFYFAIGARPRPRDLVVAMLTGQRHFLVPAGSAGARLLQQTPPYVLSYPGMCQGLWLFRWSERAEEFVKRAGFVLMAQVAGKDKGASAALLQRYLARAEQEAHDERNFVKEAVSWAIREIGQRSAELNEAAIAVAQHLQAPDGRAARWVGNDALPELTSEKVARRVAR